MVVQSLEELWSRLKSLGPEKLRSLGREDFARVLGVDPVELPLSIRMELVRRLYSEYGLSQRWLASRLRMSLRAVSRALNPGKSVEHLPSASSMLVDPEMIARAIKLIREGRARNPNDLVLELKIPLDEAEKLYRRIVENENLTNVRTIEAIAKIARYVREVERRSSRVEELLKELSKRIEEAKAAKEELLDVCSKAAENVRILKLLVKDLDNYILGFRALPTIQETLKKFLEMRKELKELEKRVDELERRIIRNKGAGNKHGIELRWKPLASEELRRLEEQLKTVQDLSKD